MASSMTRLSRYTPASTGVQGNSWTSQRGVTPTHCGGVLVVFESCLAARSPRVCGGSESAIARVLSRSAHDRPRSAAPDRPHDLLRKRESARGAAVALHVQP